LDKYYVYQHVDPSTDEVVYIGMGSAGRAWLVGETHSTARKKAHNKWADDLLNEGTTPDQFVEVLNRGLPKSEALLLENILIHKLKPKFNRSIRHGCLKVTVEIYDMAKDLKEDGYSYNHIAKVFGLSPMTIYRALNKQTVSLELAIDER
jgi:hypothetical protein